MQIILFILAIGLYFYYGLAPIDEDWGMLASGDGEIRWGACAKTFWYFAILLRSFLAYRGILSWKGGWADKTFTIFTLVGLILGITSYTLPGQDFLITKEGITDRSQKQGAPTGELKQAKWQEVTALDFRRNDQTTTSTSQSLRRRRVRTSSKTMLHADLVVSVGSSEIYVPIEQIEKMDWDRYLRPNFGFKADPLEVQVLMAFIEKNAPSTASRSQAWVTEITNAKRPDQR